MTKQKTCEQRYCFLPIGHDGLHQGMARIYDIEKKTMSKQEVIKEGMEEIVSDMVYGFGAHYTSREIVQALQEYEESQGVVILEERVQKFNTQTGQPIQPEPYTILVSLIEKEEDNERDKV